MNLATNPRVTQNLRHFLMSVLVTMLSAMPVFENISQQVQDFIFQNFVPTSGTVIQEYLSGFVEKARGLTVGMSLAVFVTSIMMMMTIEKALNRIWDTQPSRNFLHKVLIYWAVLTMGPLLVGGGLVMSSYLFNTAPGLRDIKVYLLKILPVLASAGAFFFMYLIIPNRKVKWRSALIGALIAAILFEMAKRGFTWYVTTFPSCFGHHSTVSGLGVRFLGDCAAWRSDCRHPGEHPLAVQDRALQEKPAFSAGAGYSPSPVAGQQARQNRVNGGTKRKTCQHSR